MAMAARHVERPPDPLRATADALAERLDAALIPQPSEEAEVVALNRNE